MTHFPRKVGTSVALQRTLVIADLHSLQCEQRVQIDQPYEIHEVTSGHGFPNLAKKCC